MNTRAGIFLALLLGLTGSVASAEPVEVPIVIDGGEHTFIHQLVVPAGATLLIRNATVYLDAPKRCTIGGSIQPCLPELLVMPGGTLRVENSTFDTHTPFKTGDPYRGYMMQTFGGRFILRDSTFRNVHVVAAELPGPASSEIRGNRFLAGGQTLTFVRGAEAVITNNLIEGSGGIKIRDTRSIVEANTIRVSGTGIDVQTTSVGDKALPTEPTITGNLVEGAATGIYVQNSYTATVRRNVVRGGGFGAFLVVMTGDDAWGADPIAFTENTLEGNETAVRAAVVISGGASQRFDVVVPLRRNAIIETGCHALRVDAPSNPNVSLTLDARENWWGSQDGPQDRGPGCNAISGNAVVSPWLDAPPA